MANYMIQTVAFQVFFLLIYDVFLKKETFFNWNRFYLLATALLSIILPFIKIDSFKEVVPQQYIISLPEIVLGQTASTANSSVLLNGITIESGNGFSFLKIIFYLGITVAALFFIFKLFKLLVLIIKNPKTYTGELTLVKLVNSNAAFSFFRYVFLGELLENDEKTAILKHEIIHVKQKHTLDLLFFEVFRILFWFNPLVYIYQNRITTLHEFIADAEAVKQDHKSNYYQNLLAQVFETKKISFINPFFKQSLIKKRIVMLQKSKSKQVNLFKYALLIPIVFGMLVYTSCSIAQEFDTPTVNSINAELTDEELKAKLSEEYNKLKESGVDFKSIFEDFLTNSKKYILSREEYHRQNIYFTEILRKSKKDILKSTVIDRTYSEYLEFKKTDKAKETWENSTHDGILKLVVNDLKNLTTIEEEKKTNKMELLIRDDFFTKFIMTDGKAEVTVATTEPNLIGSEVTDEILIDRVEVPFGVIEQVPVFPGCEDLSSDVQRDCMAKNISNHVNSNFNIKLADSLKLTGRQRINVIFKIDTEGNIVDVRSRAPHLGLEEEAIRVIKTLPKMIPGEHKGKKVNVPYSLPIIFEIN